MHAPHEPLTAWRGVFTCPSEKEVLAMFDQCSQNGFYDRRVAKGVAKGTGICFLGTTQLGNKRSMAPAHRFAAKSDQI
jgi:hypothetical protein